MSVKATFFFSLTQGIRAVGWSLSVVTNASSLSNAVGFTTGPGGLLPAILNCFGAGVVNTYNRFVLLPNPGPPPINPVRRAFTLVAGVLPYYTVGAGGIPGLPWYNQSLSTFPADFSQTDLLWRLSTTPTIAPVYQRNFWISGLPDAVTGTNITGVGAGATRLALDVLTNVLLTGGYQIQSVDRSGANPIKSCTLFTVIGQQYTVPAHGFAQNQIVEAVGFRSPAGQAAPRGFYMVNVVDANNITLQGSRAAVSVVVTLGGFRQLSYTYNLITNIADRSWVNHKKGRPFGLLRGRRATPRTIRA